MVEKTFTEPSRAELSRAEPARSDGESYNIPLYVSANAVERLGFCYPASLSLSPAVMKSHLPARLDWTRWCCRGDIFFFFFFWNVLCFLFIYFFFFLEASTFCSFDIYHCWREEKDEISGKKTTTTTKKRNISGYLAPHQHQRITH